MGSKLRIVTWNAIGLHHKQELMIFLNLNKIDILLVSKTHFTDQTVFQISQYSISQTTIPDGTAHGGSAVIIKKSISHHELPKYQTNEIQVTSIEIEGLPWHFTVSAIYSLPRHTISSDESKDFFQTLGSKFFAGGDWNAKHTQ